MGVESRPMTPKEREQLFGGADKPGENITHARQFQRIDEDVEERRRHAERVIARDAEAMGGIRAIIEQMPATSPAIEKGGMRSG